MPIGVGATRDFIAEVGALAGIDTTAMLEEETARLPWYSRSVDSNYLTGKRVFKMAPIHHHFEALGWTEAQVVIRFWIVAVLLALIGLSTLKLR